MHQVIGAVVDGESSAATPRRRPAKLISCPPPTVKFPTDVLPPILQAVNTENNGQKLVLEVAVRKL